MKRKKSQKAVSDEKDQPEDSGPESALIEVVTENGFYIVRSHDSEKTGPNVPYEYCFVVRTPDEEERTVTVRFSIEAIALIQRRRRTPLTPQSSCWINCAERSLATYLSEKNHLPPGAELTLKELCLDDLEVARQWYEA